MIRCLIIEDEPVAREILRQYITDAPDLVLSGECEDAISALAFLKANEVDALFLDVNMPKLSGISFLKSLEKAPQVILTTAYSEYALEGYELDVVDYLLKPYSFERFLKATNKLNQSNSSSTKDVDITVKADGKTYRINTTDILFVEAKGDYVTLHTENQKLTFNTSLKAFFDQLDSPDFIRVHKSFLVNLRKIDFVEGNQIQIGKSTIPIGNAYKAGFQERFYK